MLPFQVNEQAIGKRFAQPLTILPTRILPYAEETFCAVSSFLALPRSTYQCRVNVSAQPRCAADAAGAALTWARFTRKLRSACVAGGRPHSSSSVLALQPFTRSTRRRLAVCWHSSRSRPVPLHTPASGAADSSPFGGLSHCHPKNSLPTSALVLAKTLKA